MFAINKNKNKKNLFMAKYEQPFEDTEELFANVISEADLTRYLTITLLVNNKAKDLFKVSKANDLLKFRSGDDVIIILNEQIFEKLTDEFKRIVVEEAITYISYDSENDKVIISQPDFTAHSGVLRKHGFEKIEQLRESVKSLFQSEKETQDETEVINNG